MTERSIKSALVTGPTGAVGTALCRELANNGIRVYAVCRPASKRIRQIPVHENIKVIECDVSELTRLKELLEGEVDAFFHLAWAHTIGAGRNDMPAQIDNIRYTIDALRAASSLGCKVFIGAGSQAEYGRVEGALRSNTPCAPENGYGIAKLAAGNMSRIEALRLGIDHIWVRILSVYGPCDGEATMISSVIGKLLRGERPALTEGRQKWDYLFSEDAASAMLAMARRGVNQKTYVLGGGHSKPLREYIETIRDTVDPTLPLGFGEIAYAPNQVMHLEADLTELCEDTGFEPRVSFADGIRKTINSYAECE